MVYSDAGCFRKIGIISLFFFGVEMTFIGKGKQHFAS